MDDYIFIRVNSGGTKLSYSDLLLSIATAEWRNFDARKEIIEFVDNNVNGSRIFPFGIDSNVNSSFIKNDGISVLVIFAFIIR